MSDEWQQVSTSKSEDKKTAKSSKVSAPVQKKDAKHPHKEHYDGKRTIALGHLADTQNRQLRTCYARIEELESLTALTTDQQKEYEELKTQVEKLKKELKEFKIQIEKLKKELKELRLQFEKSENENADLLKIISSRVGKETPITIGNIQVPVVDSSIDEINKKLESDSAEKLHIISAPELDDD